MSEAAARTFAALGDPTRLGIVRRLSHGSRMNVSQLTIGTGVSRQAVSKHLAVLRSAGIVRRSKAGRETLFELEDASIAYAGEYLARLSRGWDAAIERLQAHLEDD